MLKQQSSEFGQCFISLLNPGTANGENVLTHAVSNAARYGHIFTSHMRCFHWPALFPYVWYGFLCQAHCNPRLVNSESASLSNSAVSYVVSSPPISNMSLWRVMLSHPHTIRRADQERAALFAYASFTISCCLTWTALFYYCLQVVTWLCCWSII